ncbi:hypothetical protein NBRC103581_00290 [Gluconobacter wancherniae NBRC 103581]|uniref:Lysozyme n=1 Tax=Gluconobacter wancherniae NBRC 103581 TaxID=656744 RepID=A0A511AYT5_9PROT|nr:lysozyme [Gluconobacter wancherniae]GBD55723.1 hypothetical protein NBRC103581_00290 [Gluconobacter wancherniae NBRC 103581]GBR66248.1 phage related lysozyme [Gluconobacter wancherniae NBRC 103581]GEK93370.1 hypothetical protein GWA01_11400 [Gluconobacter wancherniae NBRC 103581]
MKTNTLVLAAALLRRPDFEGCGLAPYRCPAGYWTIGIGSRFLASGTPVTATTKPITLAEAESLVMQRLQTLNTDLQNMLRVPVTDAQRAALLSWQYNVGTAAVTGPRCSASSMWDPLTLLPTSSGYGIMPRWTAAWSYSRD